MPTEIVKYVDPDSGILADYTSLQAAITAEKAIRSDLVARDEVLKLMCISSAGSPDTTQVVINSGDFVTDATRNVVIEGDNETKYQLTVNGVNHIVANIEYAHFKNLRLDGTQGGNDNGIVISTTSGVVVVENCFFDRKNTTASNRAINSAGLGTTVVINSVIYNIGNSVFPVGILCANGTVIIYNTVVSGAGGGIGIYRISGNVTSKNTIVNGFSQSFYGTIGGDYNISDLTDAPGANSQNETTVNFADASAGDFRLLAGSPGIDQGANLSADASYPFNTDIIGTVRPQGSAWDIGAFELIQQSFNPAWARNANKIIRAI